MDNIHSWERSSVLSGVGGGDFLLFCKCSLGIEYVRKSSLVVRVSDCQCTSCNGPGFDPSIRRHSGIWGAADEAVLNIVRKKREKIPPKNIFKKRICTQGVSEKYPFIKRALYHFRFVSIELVLAKYSLGDSLATSHSTVLTKCFSKRSTRLIK